MTATPTLGELLLGIEGLALLRLAFGDDAEARRARVREMRGLLDRLDSEPELAAPLAAPEYDMAEGYALWSQTYDRPLRLFPIEHPAMRRLLDRCRLQWSSMPRAGPDATASTWPNAGIR